MTPSVYDTSHTNPNSTETLKMSPDAPSIQPALAAWLSALNLSDEPVAFAEASDNCVSLCCAFASVAPELITAKDFFVPNSSGTTATRQRRYNTRRLARSLAEWFCVGSRANSPVNGQVPPTQASYNPETSMPLPEAAKTRIKSITDAARAEGDSCDVPQLRLALAQLVFFAAVNSPDKNRFVQAVFSLEDQHQDSLAYSIKCTMSEGDGPVLESSESQPTQPVLGEVRASSENAPPSASSSPPLSSSSASPKPTKSNDIMAPRGIPPVEFKALAEERDILRKKLCTAESEKNEAVEHAQSLRMEIRAGADRIRDYQGKLAESERLCEERSSELAEAKSALRNVHQNAEEIDRLRAQASSAETLESSLKRASARLEEVGDIRSKLKQMESENSAFRTNEDILTRKVEMLEAQLAASNERAQHLVTVTDELSNDIEAKTGEVRDITSRNHDLQTKLTTANEQLSHMLVEKSNVEAAAQTRAKVETQDRERELDHDLISERLSKEVGVNMAWSDIVECIRGVVEAMNEMDEMNRHNGMSEAKDSFSNQSTSSAGYVSGTGCKDPTSEGNSQDEGDTIESKVQLLPDFDVVDSKQEAQNGGDGSDQFDYAVDHPNIREIPAMARRPSLSTVPEDREGFEDEQDDDVPEPYQQTDESPASDVREVTAGYPILSNHHDVPHLHPTPNATPGDVSHSLNGMGGQNNVDIRQTRSDIPAMNQAHAMDALRLEQESQTLAAVFQQLVEVRESESRFKAALEAKERVCAELRSDLDSLIKEHDASIMKASTNQARDAEVLREKERMIAHLERSLSSKEEELASLREQASLLRDTTESLRTLEVQMASATHEHTVKVRAQEIEIARLAAKLEASELIAGKLTAAMDKTDGLTDEIYKARETYLTEMTEAAKREKEAAAESRADAEREAAMHARAVHDMKTAAATTRPPSVCCSDSARKHRRSTKIGMFVRKMLHLEVANADAGNTTTVGGRGNTTVVGGSARMQAPHPALQTGTSNAAAAATGRGATNFIAPST